MKKNILNLSILMLLSSSFNAFGGGDIPAVSTPQEIVEAAADLAAQGILDVVVHDGEQLNKISTVVVENLPNLSSALDNVEPKVVSNFSKYFTKFLGLVPEKVKTAVCSHPKIATVVGVCAVSGAAAYGFSKYAKSKGSTLSDTFSPFMAYLPTFTSAATSPSSSTTDEDIDTKALRNLIDRQVEELTKTGGNVNTVKYANNPESSRTLLGIYAEQGNLPAVKYLVEKKGADVNVLDTYNLLNGPRPAIIHAAYNGHLPVLEYLANLPETTESALKEARFWSQGHNWNPDDKAAVDTILAPRP